MSLDIKGVQDVRWPVEGDSFFWNGIHPRDQITRVTIHHSASDNPDFDAFAIASYHVNSLGYGGIGYHCVIKQDGTIQYAGDLDTWRAHVGNQNWGNIGICLMGDFTSHWPTNEQLAATRELLRTLFTEMPELPNLTGFTQVFPHRYFNATACPGDTYQEWWNQVNPDYQVPPPPQPQDPVVTPPPEVDPPTGPVTPPEEPAGGKYSLWEAIKIILINIWEAIWKKRK